MNSTVRRITFVALFALSTLACYWYFSPYLALQSMRSAAKNHDAAAINEHVDFARLRDNLKIQLSAAMDKQMASLGTDEKGMGALGARFGQALVNQLIDAMVTPEAVMAAMESGSLAPNKEAPAKSADTKADKTEWAFERQGLNVIVVSSLDAEHKPDGSFIFERYGFANWKLTGVKIPDLST